MWTLSRSGFDPADIAANGSRFMTGNGYMGCRGTPEEFGKDQLAAVTLAGVYDRVNGKWREPVNAPNGLKTVVFCDGHPLSLLQSETESHVQELDIRRGLHVRRTVFRLPGGNRVTLRTERFVSMDEPHLIAMRLTVETERACELTVETGIDADVWDLNGPHLEETAFRGEDGLLVAEAVTHELRHRVAVAETVLCEGGTERVRTEEAAVCRIIKAACPAGGTFGMTKFVGVYTSLDGTDDPGASAAAVCAAARRAGYDALLARHEAVWERLWMKSDVRIEGDDEAQFALRYSIYHLLIIAPRHSGRLSIPARGLSGQMYKGAVFWDTEMFMLPFFLHTNPDIARNLVAYRIHTLDGARRKAAEYGFEGAFYAWESQETGDDACTLFNIHDVLTGRPVRTYFRDKQVHISAAVAHAVWQYFAFTGDASVLLDGGAEVILECARFYRSYAYYKETKKRYEMLDVTGPDEYHERVHNNAYTNYMVKRTLDLAIAAVEWLQAEHPDACRRLMEKLDYAETLEGIRRMRDALYLPAPDPETGLIEQFDGYFRLEDVPLAGLKARMLHENEYLGGGNGLATTTQILKQADVVLLLHLFRDRFSADVKKANWTYYEPRTEHGSSLSPCIYALVAADLGMTEWAYPYFMRTATIDLTGDAKSHVGTLYIGGTHPAANGGAWMAAVLGFAGLHYESGVLHVNPALPKPWRSVELSVNLRGATYAVRIDRETITITPGPEQARDLEVAAGGGRFVMKPGKPLMIPYARRATS